MDNVRSSRRQLIFRVFLLASGTVLAAGPVAVAGAPNPYLNPGIRLPAPSLLALGIVGKSCGHRHVPIVIQPRYETFQSFKTIVPTTLVMVPQPSTRIVAIPSSAPANPRTISTALPDWYVTTQALRQLPSTGTSGMMFFGGMGGYVTTVSSGTR